MRPLVRCIGLGALLLGGTAVAQLPVEIDAHPARLLESGDAALAARKKLVFDFWREVLQAHHIERATEYLAESYVEHDPNVGSGGAAFVELVGKAPHEPIKDAIDELVSIVAERDLVVLAFRRELPDLEHEGQTYTTTGFDLFRIANGKIVEHWGYGTNE